jgi:hypothetical protein
MEIVESKKPINEDYTSLQFFVFSYSVSTTSTTTTMATATVTKPTLTYFNTAGRAEVPRLILEEAGVDYDYVGLTNWPELKPAYVASGAFAALSGVR